MATIEGDVTRAKDGGGAGKGDRASLSLKRTGIQYRAARVGIGIALEEQRAATVDRKRARAADGCTQHQGGRIHTRIQPCRHRNRSADDVLATTQHAKHGC